MQKNFQSNLVDDADTQNLLLLFGSARVKIFDMGRKRLMTAEGQGDVAQWKILY